MEAVDKNFDVRGRGGDKDPCEIHRGIKVVSEVIHSGVAIKNVRCAVQFSNSGVGIVTFLIFYAVT